MHGELTTLETFRSRDGADLHFRYIGEVDGRSCIVNVQFPAAQDPSGRLFQPEEHGFIVAKIMALVMTQSAMCHPNSSCELKP